MPVTGKAVAPLRHSLCLAQANLDSFTQCGANPVHLRTIADTITILARYAPARIENEHQTAGDLLVHSRLLQDLWLQQISRLAHMPSREVQFLAEEVLIALPLIQMLSRLLERSTTGNVRDQGRRVRQSTERLVQHFTDMALSRHLAVGERLRLERLKRRIEAWARELIEPLRSTAAKSHAPALNLRATMLLAPVTDLAFRQSIPGRHFPESSRSRLLTHLCELALSLLPGDTFLADGQSKSLWRRHLEFSGCNPVERTSRPRVVKQ